jgi:hypothetical protein
VTLPNTASVKADNFNHGVPITSNSVTITVTDGDAMQATSVGSGAATDSVTAQQLQAAVAQGISAWGAAGVDPGTLSNLANYKIDIANLPNGELGLEAPGQIWIDRTAAGWGWSTDGAPGRMDLATVVEHELGHALGFEHSDGPGVMEPTLAPGMRFAPTAGRAAGSGSALSTGSSLGVSSLNNLVGASTTVTPGGSITPSTALPTQSSAQIASASPASAQSVLTAIGSTPLLVLTPSSTMLSQTSPVLSGQTAATTDGIAAVLPNSPTVLMPLPQRVDTRREGDGEDPVLRDRTDSANGEATDQLIPAIYPDGIPGAVPASPAAPVEKDPSAGVSWRQGCESYLENEEWTGWLRSRDKVAARTQVEDEVLNPALKPVAAVAAFAVALGACRAFTSQTPDRGLGGPSLTAQPKTSATKRRPGRLSRWFSLCLGRRA